MTRTLEKLPSKRQFYDKLNEFVEEAYVDMLVGIPKAGEHIYKTRSGNPLYRSDIGKLVPPNSGRLLGSLPKPGRIHVKGLIGKQAKAGKITFLVRNEQVYDPIMKEHYWSKVAYNAKTDFGNTDRHRNFWHGAARQLVGKLITYKEAYATYIPNWMSKLDESEQAELEADSNQEFMDLLNIAGEEGKI